MGKMIVYRRISFSDLRDAGFILQVRNTDGKLTLEPTDKDIQKALWTLGVQTNQHLEIQDRCEHVRMSGKRTRDFSYVGEERRDKAWINSGYASDEAKMTSSCMSDMLETSFRLKRGGDR